MNPPDILLTHGYFLSEDPKEQQVMKPYAPLGMLYLSSHLKSKDFHVEVFDTTFAEREDLYHRLRKGRPSTLGIYANLMTRASVIEILGTARLAGWTTIVGGPEPGAHTQDYLDAGANFVVLGEAEATMEQLLAVINVGATPARLAPVKGIAYLDDHGNLHQNPPREQITDLDAQPWPDRKAIDMQPYLDAWRKHHGKTSLHFVTARGCPYRCRWCSHQVYGYTHRRRSAAKVVDEIEWLVNEYHPGQLFAADDVFTIHHGWLREYAAEMERRNLRIPFECVSRADRLTPEIADLLAGLGCFRVWIGSESGSQRILDAMERGVTLEQVRDAVRLCRERGMQSGIFLMWGYEGEQIEDIEATIDHLRRTDPDIFFTTVCYPIKGTPYYEQVRDRLVQLKPWDESSDRDLKIRGRHSRRYYSFADKLLRNEIQLSRLQRDPTANAANLQALVAGVQDAREGLHASASEVEA